MLTVVLMAGLPGAGKSTLARLLSHDLQWLLVEKDKYRVESLKKGIEENTAAKEAYERSFEQLRQALVVQHCSVILDSAALFPFILKTVKDIMKDTKDVQLKVILCVVERHERMKRLQEREERDFHYTRSVVDPPLVADYLELFRHLPSDTLTLYTHHHSPEECVQQAKKHINS